MTFLLAGGQSDPNLRALARQATEHGVELIDLRGAPGALPVLSFDPSTGQLTRDGQALAPSAAFLRPDVFTKGTTAAHQASMAGVLTLLRGALAHRPEVALFNRDPFGRSRSVNKGAALAAAAALGFAIPDTRIGNDRAPLEHWLGDGAALIQKPVSGGDLCRPLDLPALQRTRVIPPVIAQARVPGPDLRVFRVGTRFLSFRLESTQLDYRDDRAPVIKPTPTDPDLQQRLTRLTDQMGLSWSASDFKLCADQGPVYLETNANPMFAGFDKAAGGALTMAICAALGLIP